MQQRKPTRLTEQVKAAGWASKLSPAVLDQVLGKLARQHDANLLVGFDTADDAAVYRLNDDLALVQTVDFFTPIVDDPFTFGQIAAVNSLSDVYAMGGEPALALAIVCFPDGEDPEILGSMLAGGLSKMQEAGCIVAGGHSVRDPEIKLGYSVTGRVHPKKFWTNVGVQPGDALILTKPIGTGVISTAIKKGQAKQEWIDGAIASMTRLNQRAAEVMIEGEFPVHAATDATGFGLIGHLREMALGSKATIRIQARSIELLCGALECARAGFVPGGLNANRAFAECCVAYARDVEEDVKTLLYDPQTAGGLLLSVPSEIVNGLVSAMEIAGVSATRIGEVIPKEEKLIHVEPWGGAAGASFRERAPVIVMKFGGTSVEDASAIDRAAKIVTGRREQRPVVVVSAMSKVTDHLLAAGSAAGSGDAEKALNLSRALRERHYNAAGELLGTGVFTQFHGELAAEFDSLDELLRGIAAVGELTPRTTDLVASFGERMSSRMVTAAFVARDLPAVHVDSRTCVITDDNHMKAAPLFSEIDLRLARRVSPLIEDGRIPIMGGFIGSTREGATTTLGRGGSDFTAAIVGAGLNAESIEIWTDVDGMMTTDPRISKDARRIRNISFEEAAELAYFGAKVLHPATLLPAIQKDIPVYVLNSRNPECEGTRISARTQPCRNLFKAIAAKRRITIVDVVATRMLMAHGFLKSIFEVFDRHRCPVDMVSTSEVSISLTVDSTEAIPAIAADLEKLADVKYEGRKAIVCLVGQNIRGTRGIAARVFGALPDTNVRMISQGASEINISFVIDEDDVEETVRSLHHAFFSDPDPAVFA